MEEHIHNAEFINKEYDTDISKFIICNQDYFINNHYCCQSKEFWNNIKCTRGDSDNYLVRKDVDFENYDLNDIEDLELYNQNIDII